LTLPVTLPAPASCPKTSPVTSCPTDSRKLSLMPEQRMFFGNVGVRSASGGGVTLYAEPVVYDAWSELLFQSFYERMRPGCFADSLASGRDVIATVNHDPSLLLGRTSAGTLKITPTARGLAVEAIAPDTGYARDLATLLKRGDIRGASF